MLQLNTSLKSEFNEERIDCLINNGGFVFRSPSFTETTLENFEELMNVHFKGVFFSNAKSTTQPNR